MSETTAVTSDGETVEYRDIPGCPGYRVGNDGSLWTAVVRDVVLVGGGLPGLRGSRVRVGDEWRKMRTRPNKKGYLTVIVRVGGRKRTLKVHRTVLLAFVGPCPDGMEACHGPGGKLDNRLANLRWDTSASNVADRYTHGETLKGEKNVKHKLTEQDVRDMRVIYRGGGISYRALAGMFGVTASTAHKAVVGLQWGHVA